MNVTSGRRAHHADRPKRVTPDLVTSVREPSDRAADAAHDLGRVLARIGDAQARERDEFAHMLAEATAAWWMRRAETFEWARPRPGDYRGRASDAAIAELDRRLAATAAACRRHARLVIERGPTGEDYALLEEVLTDARRDL